jgi:hypothetical protein
MAKLPFTADELKKPESAERVLRIFQQQLDSGQAAAQHANADLQSQINEVKTSVRKSTLVPSGSGLTVVQTPEQILITNTGTTSIAGTPNQVIVTGSGTVTLSTPQNIDTAAAVQFGSLNLSSQFIVNASGLPTKSNNVALAGQGLDLVVVSASALAQTAANTNIATYTTGSSGGSFEIGGYINVTAFTGGTISLQCDYTDPGGTARTVIIPLVALAGTISTTVGSLTDASAVITAIQTSGANTIKLYTTVSIFVGTYNVYVWLRQAA